MGFGDLNSIRAGVWITFAILLDARSRVLIKDLSDIVFGV